jgi:hypothetical protein
LRSCRSGSHRDYRDRNPVASFGPEPNLAQFMKRAPWQIKSEILNNTQHRFAVMRRYGRPSPPACLQR